MSPDFGTASISVNAASGERTVVHADPIIGVDDCLLDGIRGDGRYDGGTLILDTEGEYRYRRLGPSTATPGVTRFERIDTGQEEG